MSHKSMILSWLQSGKTITQRQAYQKPFYCYRLGARIYDLRNAGHNIITIEVPNESGKGKHARYSLATGSGSVCE